MFLFQTGRWYYGLPHSRKSRLFVCQTDLFSHIVLMDTSKGAIASCKEIAAFFILFGHIRNVHINYLYRSLSHRNIYIFFLDDDPLANHCCNHSFPFTIIPIIIFLVHIISLFQFVHTLNTFTYRLI